MYTQGHIHSTYVFTNNKFTLPSIKHIIIILYPVLIIQLALLSLSLAVYRINVHHSLSLKTHKTDVENKS